jgi:hypothetical protein
MPSRYLERHDKFMSSNTRLTRTRIQVSVEEFVFVPKHIPVTTALSVEATQWLASSQRLPCWPAVGAGRHGVVSTISSFLRAFAFSSDDVFSFTLNLAENSLVTQVFAFSVVAVVLIADN